MTIMTRVTGITPVRSDEDGAEAQKFERLAVDLIEDVEVVRRELEGAPGHVVDRQLARHLESGTAARQVQWVRDQLAEAERMSAAVAERREQLRSPAIILRGHDDESPRALAAERMVLDHLRGLDPVERPGAVRALFGRGDVVAMRAVLHDPLAGVAGPLIDPEQLAEIAEEYSRRQHPDAWERADTQGTRASRQELYARLTLEALEKITGQPLRDDPIADGASGE